ncbi:hypothetical protein [Epilithonimonas zeae]|uniref:hypothetical protein n=1 Tax=Epilithonimonas zeae TaxID=1416779 RepID=UPI00200D719F|nr:hypothetical protein [Epilithonimonas zeae]UQB69252.1 hypothetical protein KI430_02125 [Epilithonimonas zeae]
MRLFTSFILLLSVTFTFAQVGINTSNPHPSAALEIQSGNALRGILIPRMTTLQRNTISSPAESLLVFDTTEKAFFYYNTSTTSWLKLANDLSSRRDNFKIVKSAADLAPELAAGGGSSYLLDSNKYYEINGTIALAFPINLNDAYVSGLDANEDVLSFPGGTVFRGNTGGSIRNITITGARAFDLTGPGATSNTSLLVQNTIVQNTGTSVGNISGYGLYFGNIVNFINNANGITYSNIGNLLLNTQAWQDSNNGTFETFTGTFGHIQKASGFSTVNGSDIALDVSSNTLNVGTGILQGTVFSGTTSASSGMIKGYTTGAYPGYYFSNAWTVDAPGTPRESDDAATGDINLSAAVGTGFTTSFTTTGTAGRKKITGTTTSNNLFRFTRDGDNIITYRGNKTRYFQVAGSVSYQGNSDLTIILYIAKNGVVITETKVYGRGTSGLFTTSGILALPIIGTVQLKKDDYIEIWAERYEGSGNMQTVSLNLTAR